MTYANWAQLRSFVAHWSTDNSMLRSVGESDPGVHVNQYRVYIVMRKTLAKLSDFGRRNLANYLAAAETRSTQISEDSASHGCLKKMQHLRIRDVLSLLFGDLFGKSRKAISSTWIILCMLCQSLSRREKTNQKKGKNIFLTELFLG